MPAGQAQTTWFPELKDIDIYGKEKTNKIIVKNND